MNPLPEAEGLIHDLIEDHLAWLATFKHASQTTITERRRFLRFAHQHLPHGLANVIGDEIAGLLDGGGWGKWTVYTYDSALRTFYRWAVLTGRATANPMAMIAKPPMGECEPRPMDDKYLAILLAAAEPIPTITLFGRYQGLRRAEIAGLFWEDVTEQITTIRRAKGGRRETTPTHPLVWQHLQALEVGPATERGAHPLIWNHYTRRPATPGYLTYIWAKTRRELGLPPEVVMHCNRHRFGTDLRRSTKDLLLTSVAMRHRRIETTRIYTEVATSEVMNAVRALGSCEPGLATN